MFIYYVYFASFNQKLAFIGYFDVIKPQNRSRHLISCHEGCHAEEEALGGVDGGSSDIAVAGEEQVLVHEGGEGGETEIGRASCRERG